MVLKVHDTENYIDLNYKAQIEIEIVKRLQPLPHPSNIPGQIQPLSVSSWVRQVRSYARQSRKSRTVTDSTRTGQEVEKAGMGGYIRRHKGTCVTMCNYVEKVGFNV